MALVKRAKIAFLVVIFTTIVIFTYLSGQQQIFYSRIPHGGFSLKHSGVGKNGGDTAVDKATALTRPVLTKFLSMPVESSSIAELPFNLFQQQKSEAKPKTIQTCHSEDMVRKFVMTKIEKTGSSTLYGILARFILTNHLNMLVPSKSLKHIDWRKGRKEGWVIGPGDVDRADVLINHARYSREIFDKHIVPGYKYIVPVREPVAWFKSAVTYFQAANLTPGTTPEQVVGHEEMLYKSRESGMEVESWYHLAQLQWLGFNYTQHDNLTAIKEHIAYIVPKIDLPMLNDQFDASLVLLKRRFCWNYTDIFYTTYVTTDSKTVSLSEHAVNKLLSAEVNLGEKLLYEALNNSWWSQPELGVDNFWEEVSHFTSLNNAVSAKWCKYTNRSSKGNTTTHIPASQWHPPIEVTSTLCGYLSAEYYALLERTQKYAKRRNIDLPAETKSRR